MITFKQFLNEGKAFDFDRFLDDCDFVLKELKGSGGRKFLYHGTAEPPASYDIRPFKFRERPRDTMIAAHNYMNLVFTDMFGWPIRNGLFTTGRMNDAMIYARGGPVCAVFPIGKFEWVCGLDDDLNDLTGYIDRVAADIRDADVDRKLDYDERYKLAWQHVAKKIRHMNWLHNENLPRCLGSEHEIMIKADKFYFFNIQSDLWVENLEPQLKEML